MESASVPFGFSKKTIACGARRFIDNGKTLADQAIEQSTFSDVGSANESNNWFGHGPLFLYFLMGMP